jgi:hypothetical protein
LEPISPLVFTEKSKEEEAEQLAAFGDAADLRAKAAFASMSVPEREETFSGQIAQLMNHDDTMALLQHQQEMQATLVQARKTLAGFNQYSAQLYQSVNQEFKAHVKMLLQLRKELDSVYRRIRTLKQTLNNLQ